MMIKLCCRAISANAVTVPTVKLLELGLYLSGTKHLSRILCAENPQYMTPRVRRECIDLAFNIDSYTPDGVTARFNISLAITTKVA